MTGPRYRPVSVDEDARFCEVKLLHDIAQAVGSARLAAGNYRALECCVHLANAQRTICALEKALRGPDG